MLRRRGEPVGLDRSDLTVAEVAEGLGCAERTVTRWIGWGWLRATAMVPDGQGKYYRITETDLRRFCLAHAAAVARGRPDMIWYTDLNGLIRFHARQVTLLEQLRHYPAADHDDGPDALHMLWVLATHSGGSRVYQPPRHSRDDKQRGGW